MGKGGGVYVVGPDGVYDEGGVSEVECAVQVGEGREFEDKDIGFVGERVEQVGEFFRRATCESEPELVGQSVRMRTQIFADQPPCVARRTNQQNVRHRRRRRRRRTGSVM